MAPDRQLEGVVVIEGKGRRERRPLVHEEVAAKNRRDHVTSDFLELIGRGLARAAILGDFIAHLLALAQIMQARALDRADVHKNVRAAVIRLYEAKALLTVEPFHSSGSHLVSPNLFREKAQKR